MQIDEDYVAFLLFEAMYKDGKIDEKTYGNVVKMKDEYLAKVAKNTRKRRGKTKNG